ncbi:hypothetical protein DFP72DRAFT_875375 [Ephemerocybe angulata]|uniref:Uncharacterized protein n=1 Tax=Ephemerocybe angulata TaxID=980116 RepID=A0A8H6MCF0_9AGAR|nr:hypothetical protein DFP72DRAFT_875375 [Tulosesus angulatus]
MSRVGTTLVTVTTGAVDPVPPRPRNASELLADAQFTRQLVAIFCDGLFSVADEATTSTIIRRGMEHCRSAEILAQVVQSRVFASHTAFYWIIMNHGDHRGIPPLLVELVRICESHFTDEAQDDILQAFLLSSDDELFQYLKESMPSVVGPIRRSFFGDEEDRLDVRIRRPTSSQPQLKVSLEFSIPKFADRMLVDQGISYHFAAAGSIWCLKAAMTPVESGSHSSRWHFLLEETHTNSIYRTWIEASKGIRGRIVSRASESTTVTSITYHKRDISLLILRGDSCSTSAASRLEQNKTFNVDRVPSTITLDIGNMALAQLQPNPYTSNPNRRLCGSITVQERTERESLWVSNQRSIWD